jgi:arsenite-transporting ATPase
VSAHYRFVGGKGGVGKTTCAAALALGAAERGRCVLVVSTDPAHSLGDALATRLTARTTRVPTRRGTLMAVELDADRALTRWLRQRRRLLGAIASRGTYLDDDDVERLLHLAMPGVDELVGLLELVRLAGARPYDDVVVDTAPTGHTLRLLAMPETLCRIAAVLTTLQAKHRFLAESLGAGHRRDATDALIEEIDGDGQALAALLRDPRRSTFTWVVTPELLPLAETRRAVRALESSGMTVGDVVINRITVPHPRCAGNGVRAATERRVIACLQRTFCDRPLRCLPVLDREPRGLPALRAVDRALHVSSGRAGARARAGSVARGTRSPVAAAEADPRWTEVVAPPTLRLLLFGGKGGVGKTTCAATAALSLAWRTRDRHVLLLSTDPAHSLADVLGVPVGHDGGPVPGAGPNLVARELDAARALEERRTRYRDGVDALFDRLTGSNLDPTFDRAAVQELIDLAPPGLDELFGILAVVDALFHRVPRPYDLLVVDTAPTGHTLRLLGLPEAALGWVHALLAILLKYRGVVGLGDLAGDLLAVARGLRELQQLLRDPSRTRFVAVTRPGELPVRETARLLTGLRRRGIGPAAIVVNAATAPGCARCTAAAREARAVARARTLRPRGALLTAPALAPPPRGVRELLQWGRSWSIDDAGH